MALRVDELRRFREGLERIDRTLRGEAVLESLEEWIRLTVRCQGNGSLDVTGELHGSGTPSDVLSFTISDLDQTDLAVIIADLEEIERHYPLLGG